MVLGALASGACGERAATPADAPAGEAVLEVDPDALAFGAVTVGETSEVRSVTVTNAGTVATGAVQVETAGAIASFAVAASSTCAGALAPGASCRIDLTFSPAAVGAAMATATASVDGAPSVTVALTGTGVAPADQPPTAVDDAATLAEDAAATEIDVLANDLDPDGGPKAVAGVTQPAAGAVAIVGGGIAVSYQPAPDFHGTDVFTYTLNGGSTATVIVTVTPVDDPPVAVDDIVITMEDTPIVFDARANDTDIDGGPLAVIAVTAPAHGAATIEASGALRYAPAPDFHGADAFTYTLNGGSTATVTVTVLPVDDPPIAFDDAFTVARGAADQVLDVLLNDLDLDGGPKLVVAATQPAHGSVTITGGGTAVAYTPHAAYCNTPPGTALDSFTYTLNGGSSATVSLTVTCPPVSSTPPPLFVSAPAVATSDWAHEPAFGDFNEDGHLDVAVTGTTGSTVLVRLGDGTGSFGPEAVFPAGAVPISIEVQDFDGDGHLDLAVANVGNDTVGVLAGDGAGGFAPMVAYPVGEAPRWLLAVDLDGDGRPDLVTANAGPFDAGDDTLSVLLNTGAGFAPATTVTVGDNPRGLAAGDFDGDGDQDLAVANSAGFLSTPSIGILLGNGDGTFADMTTLAIGTNPLSVAAGRLDGDATIDLVVVSDETNLVYVFAGNGDGTFASPTTTAMSGTGYGLVLGDLDNDLDLDLVVANPGGFKVSFLVNDGTGGFVESRVYAVADEPTHFAIGDLDLDGALDMVSTGYSPALPNGGGTMSVLMGTAPGEAFAAPRFPVGESPQCVATGDFNGDGFEDVFVSIPDLPDILVLFGDGVGSFSPPVPLGLGMLTSPRCVIAVDVDLDTHLDLVVTIDIGIVVLYGRSNGMLGSIQWGPSGPVPGPLIAADLNGDGYPEVVTGNLGDDTVSVLINIGGMYFSSAMTSYEVGPHTTGLFASDLDGDGDLDLAVSGFGVAVGEITILINDGGGELTAGTPVVLPGVSPGVYAPSAVVAGRFDGDADLDLAIIDRGSSAVRVRLNNGDATFSGTLDVPLGAPPFAVATGRFNEDPHLDLAITLDTGDVVIVLGDGAGGFTAGPRFTAGHIPRGIRAADFTGDGRLDLVTANLGGGDITLLEATP